MKTIWKYRLLSHGQTVLQMPAGAKALSVANQDEAVTLWALVDPTRETTERRFYSSMTGGSVPSLAAGTLRVQFLGTVQLGNGAFVAHVFEE